MKERKKGELFNEISRIKNETEKIHDIENSLQEALQAFYHEYHTAMDIIYPYGITESTPVKNWKSYNKKERTAILNLVNVTYEMLRIQNAG